MIVHFASHLAKSTIPSKLKSNLPTPTSMDLHLFTKNAKNPQHQNISSLKFQVSGF
jgi:hypothetical protein